MVLAMKASLIKPTLPNFSKAM